MEVRRAILSDSSLLEELYQKIFRESFSYYPEDAKVKYLQDWSKEKIDKRIGNFNRIYLIASEEYPVAFVAGKIRGEAASIIFIGVLKVFQGQGIGSNLILEWERWAKEKGAKDLRIKTTNKENVRYYERFGFICTNSGENRWELVEYEMHKKIPAV